MDKPVFKQKRKRNRRKNQIGNASLYRPIPTNMKVVLRGRTYDTGSSATAPVYSRYGLVEFLQRGGSYSDTLFQLYRHAKVHHSKITLRLVNMSSEPLILAVAPLPADWNTGSPTLGEILDVPRCVRKTTGGSGGMDKVVITNSAYAKDLLGAEYVTARYQMDSTQAASSTPIISNEPTWNVVVSSFNAATAISYRLEVELEWLADFYDLDSS